MKLGLTRNTQGTHSGHPCTRASYSTPVLGGTQTALRAARDEGRRGRLYAEGLGRGGGRQEALGGGRKRPSMCGEGACRRVITPLGPSSSSCRPSSQLVHPRPKLPKLPTRWHPTRRRPRPTPAQRRGSSARMLGVATRLTVPVTSTGTSAHTPRPAQSKQDKNKPKKEAFRAPASAKILAGLQDWENSVISDPFRGDNGWRRVRPMRGECTLVLETAERNGGLVLLCERAAPSLVCARARMPACTHARLHARDRAATF